MKTQSETDTKGFLESLTLAEQNNLTKTKQKYRICAIRWQKKKKISQKEHYVWGEIMHRIAQFADETAGRPAFMG